jgi:putative membrane protein
MLALSLVAWAACYAYGLARLWRKAGVGQGIRRLEAAAFFAGWGALAIALSPAVDDWSDTWLVAHMAQHELMMVISAPLIAVSAPAIAMMWVVPDNRRRSVFALFRRDAVARSWHAVTMPPAVFILHALALWAWHVPALYEAALANERIHALEHLCFFGTAALFWWGIAHGRYGRLAYGASVLYVFATGIHSGVLGALLALSPNVWYPSYAAPHGGSLTPLEDQQLAGLLMWVPGGAIFAVCGLVLFSAWLRESDRRTRFRGRPVREVTEP